MSDAVHHPSHYTAYKGLEIIDLTEQMNFNRGNAVKYIARAGLKNPETEIQDLEKAQWYIAREIQRLRAAVPSSSNNDVAQRCPCCGVLWLMVGDKRNVTLTDDKVVCGDCGVDFSFDQLRLTRPASNEDPVVSPVCPGCLAPWTMRGFQYRLKLDENKITCSQCTISFSLTDYLDRKTDLLMCHKTQCPHCELHWVQINLDYGYNAVTDRIQCRGCLHDFSRVSLKLTSSRPND